MKTGFGSSQRKCRVAVSASVDDRALYDIIGDKIKAKIPPGFDSLIGNFFDDYKSSNYAAKMSPESFQTNIVTFLSEVQRATADPFKFSSFHTAIRQPFDYYKWGNDFLRPLVILEQSKVEGLQNAEKIAQLIAKGDNVIIMSNHQTEADPQVISILLELHGLSAIAEKIIFIAGHKVTTDPVAIPFSMGRNLLCIHSKKHIKNPPEKIAEKQAQNLESMKALGSLTSQGGSVFWVAPSGGRDRPDESGAFVVAPFDVKALDMFKLIAMQSNKPMHFFPMAMYSHQLVPPPKGVSSDVGEERSAKRGAVSMTILEEMDGLGGLKDAEYRDLMQSRVVAAYKDLCAWHQQQQQ